MIRKPVVGWEGLYEVSDTGRVFSLLRQTAKGDFHPEIEMHPSVTWAGYLSVCLYDNPRIKRYFVHTLVLTAFIGPKPFAPGIKYQTRHLDGNKKNNHLCNLKWGTAKENCDDRFKHGTHRCGEDSPLHKITTRQVLQMRNLRAHGTKLKDLASRFNICIPHVCDIVNNKKWKQVDIQNEIPSQAFSN